MATASPRKATQRVEADSTVTTDEPEQKATPAPGQCVVDDGTAHMGRAVNGVVCSAHAMRYGSAGKLRGA